ncbi:hypothetical protein ACFL96_11295 [Thermoproteota archaeon]
MKSKYDWTNDFAKLWGNFKPPVRPSRYDLAVLREYLDKKIKKKGKKVRVLILGSTPEFRDVVLRRKLVPYVVDYHKDNYIAMGTLRKYKGKEIHIHQDWRKLKLKEKFDLVFAEASLNMLKKKEVPVVLKRVNSLLEEDGLFLSKTWLKTEKKLTMDYIIKLYRKKYRHMKFKFAMSNLNYSFSCGKGTSVNTKKEFFRMKKLYEKGILTKAEFDSYCNLGYEVSNLDIFMPLKKWFDSTARKYMKIKKIIYPKPIGPSKMPIYVLGKK